MKRVVITGMGAITPVGCTVDSFWESLKSGKNGIDFITRFDTSDIRVKLAAEVKDFDPKLYMEKGDVRRSDRFVQFAVCAASQAVADSGIEGEVLPERFGVYFGSGIGGFNTFVSEHTNLMEKVPPECHHFLFPK